MALAWHCYGAFWAFDGVWQPIGIDWHLASRNCWHQAWFHTSVGSIGSVHRPPGCPGQRWPARSVDEGPDWTTENSYDGIPHTRIPTTEKNDKTWQNSRSEIGNWDSHRPFIQQMTWHSLPNMQIGTCFRLILTRHSWTSAFLTIYYISESGLSWHMHLHGSGHRHITAWAASYLTYRPALQSSSMLMKAVQFCR